MKCRCDPYLSHHLDFPMRDASYDVVQILDPNLYRKIVAFASSIKLDDDQLKVRSNIEQFIMEVVSLALPMQR